MGLLCLQRRLYLTISEFVSSVLTNTVPRLAPVKKGDFESLSLCLLGIVIGILHEMLAHFCPAAGVKIGDNTIFDMLYADNCTLTAVTPGNLQLQLDTVMLLCQVFGIKLNVRNEIMVLKKKGMNAPVASWH